MTETSAMSGDSFEPVRQHWRDSSYHFDVGPGWQPLVLKCHQALVAEFPQYELLAVKQQWGQIDLVLCDPCETLVPPNGRL